LELKVDLHIHTANDLVEIMSGGKTDLIPPKKLIDLAVEKNFDAIALTHHGIIFRDPDVENYAREKGLLLIPGIEAYVEHKHVLLINFPGTKHINSFEDLCKYKNSNTLIIAPHPYYFFSQCIGKNFQRYIHCFDAVEYCHLYYKFINPNRKAIKLARKYKLPIVGNSDTHREFHFGTTYSIVHTEEKSIPAIIKAIKQGDVEYVSHPLPFRLFLKDVLWSLNIFPVILMRFTIRVVRALLEKIEKVFLS
jgi:predicted metal-dependent phosphoesterase TrpH